MKHSDRLQAFVEVCHRRTSDAKTIEADFRRSICELGFRYYACCSHVDPLQPPSQAVMLHNYPAAWVQRFSEDGLYRIDPVLQHAERHATPFSWDKAFAAQLLTEAQRNLLAEAATLGLAHGYTIPIPPLRIPGSLRASCSVVPDSGTIQRQAYVTLERMAIFMHTAVSSMRVKPRIIMSVKLTPREKQVLELVAQGKDDWAIGQLLSISENTVHWHVERIKKRFGVHVRGQAALLAFEAGVITLGDVRLK